MEKEDKRKLNPESQYELRKQVVRLKSRGRSSSEIAEQTGLSRQSVNAIWRSYNAGGPEAIKLKTRGRMVGQKRKLSPAQEKELKALMVEKTPEQLSFKFALWTRAAVQAVVRRRFKIELPLRTISSYLSRWGFSAQKPTRLAYEQNPKAVKEWLESTYPAIKERAAEEKAEIHWGDESGMEASSYAAKGFAPVGKTPVIRLSASLAHTRINMISAITNQGKMRFMLYEEKLNSELFIKFLKRLVQDAPKKVFLIVDNLKVHHSRPVTEWLEREEVAEKIEVFYLPSYSPELNPDERLNCDLKYQVQSGLVCRSKSQVRKKVRSTLKMIQNHPERVLKYFEDQRVAYAA